jgi:Concanavalin A-like lectin/glucanases superfamily
MPPNIPGSFKARAALRAWCLLALVLWPSLALCALPCTTEAASSLSKPPNNLGLVGYWSFNEGTSTVAADFSGNRNTGTLNNFANPPTPTSGWRNGKLGKALQFDGNTTYVEVPDAANLNFTSNQSFTVAAWVYLPALPLTWKGIVTKGRDFDDWYGLWVSDTGRWYLASDEANDPNWPASRGWALCGWDAGRR